LEILIMSSMPVRRYRREKILQRVLLSGLLLSTIAMPGAAPGAEGEAGIGLQITSSAFVDGGVIPRRYTCDGSDRSPPLSWSGVPAGTKSLVLIVDDPDAPDPAAPKMTWVHWVLSDLPAGTRGLEEGVSALPAGTVSGLNDWKRTGYRGPCPPIGRHRYFHKLYALNTELRLGGTPTKAEVIQAMRGHVLAEAALMGTYQH
jgi:Raf kinase inhibitor-like YbhB/YbcL family protein